MRRLPLATFIILAAPTVLAAQHFTRVERIASLPAPALMDTTGMFQAVFARVGDDVFIGGQPTEKALRDMKARGVTTVVNLRTPEEMQRTVNFDEAALVKQLGMKYVYLPVRGTDDFPYATSTVTSFADALKRADGKVLLHCTIGWRASHLWAAYLIAQRGVAVDSALGNARAINLMDTMKHTTANGHQPVEDFLGRVLPTLGHP